VTTGLDDASYAGTATQNGCALEVEVQASRVDGQVVQTHFESS